MHYFSAIRPAMYRIYSENNCFIAVATIVKKFLFPVLSQERGFPLSFEKAGSSSAAIKMQYNGTLKLCYLPRCACANTTLSRVSFTANIMSSVIYPLRYLRNNHLDGQLVECECDDLLTFIRSLDSIPVC